MNEFDKATGALRTKGVRRGSACIIEFEGRNVPAFEGETVLAALWAAEIHALRLTARKEEPRAFFCGMGVCFDCLVTIDGKRNIRACLEPVRPGMRITLQHDSGTLGHHGTAGHAEM